MLWVLLTTSILIGLVAFSWTVARLWCRPTRRFPQVQPSETGLPANEIKFSSGGVTLRGWFVSSRNSDNSKVIIIAHGWSSNTSDVLPFARTFHESGFGVLLYDARGHGRSPSDGPITIRKFAADISAAIDFIVLRVPNPPIIGVFGFSMGGSAAILSTAWDRRILATASCSAFADPRKLTLDYLRRYRLGSIRWPVCVFIERWLETSMEAVSPVMLIDSIRKPLLILHGEQDTYIPVSNAHDLTARSTSFARKSILSECNHYDIKNDPRLHKELADFYIAHLSVPVAPDPVNASP